MTCVPRSGTQGFRTHFTLDTPRGSTADRAAPRRARTTCATRSAAAAAAASAGATLAQIAAGLAAVRAVPGRLQFKPTQPAAPGSSMIPTTPIRAPCAPRSRCCALLERAHAGWCSGTWANWVTSPPRPRASRGVRACPGHRAAVCTGPLAAAGGGEFRCRRAAGSTAPRGSPRALDAGAARGGPEVRLLVKGSRFNRLERVVEALAPRHAARRRGALMLYWLTQQLPAAYSGLPRVLVPDAARHPATASALGFSLLVGPSMIARLSHYQIGQVVRDDGPKTPPAQGRHAHHGRRADPRRDAREHAAVGGAARPLRVDGAGRDVRLRPDRLLRRLSEARGAQLPRADRRAGSTSGSRSPDSRPPRRCITRPRSRPRRRSSCRS